MNDHKSLIKPIKEKKIDPIIEQVDIFPILARLDNLEADIQLLKETPVITPQEQALIDLLMAKLEKK